MWRSLQLVMLLSVASCNGSQRGKPFPAQAEEPEVQFTLDRGQAQSHYGVRLKFKSSGHTIEESGERTMIEVQLENDEREVVVNLRSDEWTKIRTDVGIRWRVDKAPGFDPKRATFTMFRP